MKRSEINAIQKRAKEFLTKHKWTLPPWAYWGPQEWAKRGDEISEIKECMLGWDITDFGSGDFAKRGLFLFTLRNGNLEGKSDKQYAEKIMIVEEMQETPFHFHRHKMEDIINRGGGVLKIELYASTPDEGLSDDDFEVSIDGIKRQVKGGDVVTLKTGESICLEPFVYHRFWSEEGTTLVGEVSLVNDDNTDNRFYEEVGRFPAIVEDEAPLHLLVSDYT
ncbi:MAG: D-lyxose/D-mannose family sugar isomerase [Sphaerochaetaceae bacterium]|jgi:D-lyxose ketol-isomerase|nr:D-lyxose/D-mannose family sugar isomerase [Spirochaetales bacterium]